MEVDSFTGDFERQVRFCLFHQETLFIGESKRHVKEASRNGKLSIGALLGEPGGGSFT